MGCKLTQSEGLPDYLRKILKEIDEGDDQDLKDCACKLVTPVTDEGCEIQDEDKKVGAFPFCSTLVTDGVGDNTDYPLKLTLKQAMDLYWQTTKWNYVASANGSYCTSSTNINFTGNKRISQNFVDEVGPPPPQKNLVCRNSFQYLTDYTGQICGKDGCQPLSDNNVVACSMFESLNLPMKYKKEGNIYYFYPYFGIFLGVYAVCTATTTQSAIDCTQAQLGTIDGPESSVTAKILGKECFPFKMYTKLFGTSPNPGGCSGASGSGSISTLEFIK